MLRTTASFAFAPLLLVAGCGGVLFETRAEVVNAPRASMAIYGAPTASHEVRVQATAPTLPGFEAGAHAEVAPEAPPGAGLSAGAPVVLVGHSAPPSAPPVSATPSPGPSPSPTLGPSPEIERRARVPRAGVWSPQGQPTALSALLEGGVQVDGVEVRFDELRALADLRLGEAGSGRLATDGALEAWAELEHDALPRRGGQTRVVVRARAPEAAASVRGRLRVHLVIDASSSMQRSWPDMLDATRRLVADLHPDDQLQVVAYGSEAVEVYGLARVGDGRAARAALGTISVGGGTHIEAGLRLAYGSVGGDLSVPDLVILFSDGVPNHGALEAGELGGLAGAAARGHRVTTCSVGLGTAFDARVLRRIAREGGGTYQVGTDLDALAATMIAQIDAHARLAVQDFDLRVNLSTGVELLGVEDGDAGAQPVPGGVALRLPGLDPGQERRVILRVRVPASARAIDVARVQVSYRSPRGRVQAQRTLSASVADQAHLRAGSSATSALLDAHLAASLERVGAAALRGDAAAAQRALVAHSELLEGRAEHATHQRMQARARVSRRLGGAVAALIPGSDHAQRRRLSLELGELSVHLSR